MYVGSRYFLPVLLSLLLTATFIQCFDNPALEIVVVIKASTASVTTGYFNSAIVPFLSQLYLVFPDEVSNDKPYYLRISVNVGGETLTWPQANLNSQKRSEYLAHLKTLKPIESNGEAEGNSRALTSAMYTYYDSSVAINRITILMTDKVLLTEYDTNNAKNLRLISDQFFIIGIASKDNPTFYDSVQAASKLTGESDWVFSSLESASNNENGISTQIQKRLSYDLRPCRGLIFLNEGTTFIEKQTQINYADLQNHLFQFLLYNVAFSTDTFYDILDDKFFFIHPPKVGEFKIRTGVDDVSIYNNQDTVYKNLAQITDRVQLPYLAIVVLTQADNMTNVANTMAAMSHLAVDPNIDLFVFDASQNKTVGQNYFKEIVPANNIIDVYEASTDEMSVYYQKIIEPAFNRHMCDGDNATPPPGGPTTQRIPTTTSGSSVTDFHCLVLILLIMQAFL
uniref:VWFA domain-containing protein n=1 Tax=Panagrellus redivivus TaxID=6233 RepID=A0A7E4W304_PANRE